MTFGAAATSRRCGSRRRSSSTAWTWAQRSASTRVSDAEPRADLEDDVGRVELGQPGDDAEDVVVDEEMLPEGLLRLRPAHGAGSPKAALAFRSICLLQRRDVLAASLGQDGERVQHVGGLVPLAAQRLRGEIRAVRLGEDPVGGNGRRSLAELGRLRVRDVPRERDVVAALDADVEEPGRREAVEDHCAWEPGESVGRVGVRIARVDHDR